MPKPRKEIKRKKKPKYFKVRIKDLKYFKKNALNVTDKKGVKATFITVDIGLKGHAMMIMGIDKKTGSLTPQSYRLSSEDWKEKRGKLVPVAERGFVEQKMLDELDYKITRKGTDWKIVKKRKKVSKK